MPGRLLKQAGRGNNIFNTSQADKHSSLDNLLVNEGVRWDRLIAADLASELETLLGERVDDLIEMRRFLAVKGYRELRKRIATDVGDKTGNEAIRSMAAAMRRYALERPGLSAATFRNAKSDCPEWQRESIALVATITDVLATAGVAPPAIHAIRILRGIVRGLVLHEMSSSFLDPTPYDETFAMAIEVYIRGLDALKAQIPT